MRRLAALVLILLALAGCIPGSSGWYCDTDSDCSGGRVCKETNKGSICLARDAHSYSGRPSGWFTFIGGIALFTGIPLMLGVMTLFKRRKERRAAALLAARPRLPRPAGPPPVCPRCDGLAQKMGLPQPVPDWQELSGSWYCRTCRAPF